MGGGPDFRDVFLTEGDPGIQHVIGLRVPGGKELNPDPLPTVIAGDSPVKVNPIVASECAFGWRLLTTKGLTLQGKVPPVRAFHSGESLPG